MNAFRYVLCAFALLACQSCVALPAPHEDGKARAAEAATPHVAVAPAALPSKHLARVGPEARLREASMPKGWQFRRGSAGVLVDGQGHRIITGSADAPLVGIEPSQDGKWLAHHGSGRYSVYAADGHLLQTVPMFELAEAGGLVWRWKDATSLVGVAEFPSTDATADYPETDVLPARTLLVLYPLDGDGNTLYALDAPKPPAGTVVRLEGVTLQGALVLSAVVPAEYFGGAPEQALGVYEVE